MSMCKRGSKTAAVGAILAAGWSAGWPARAQAQVEIPPGWEIVTIVENEEGRFCNWPDINDRGDLVFECMDWPDQSMREIFLYTRGQLIQITDDGLKDGLPKINNKQEIVWQRELDADGDFDIVLLRDDEIEVISAESYTEGGPDINDAGHIVWQSRMDGGRNDVRIFYFDGKSTRQISDNTLSNQIPRINQQSQIVWNRYNFEDAPWSSHVMLYRNGETLQLSEGPKQINFAGINDIGQVVWVSAEGGLEKWDDGETVSLLPDGKNPQINSREEISIARWDETTRSQRMWLLRDGRWWPLTEGPGDAVNGAINTRGEIVWQYGIFPYGIALFTRSAFAADLDFDGDVDLRDFSVLQSCLGREGSLGLDCLQADLDYDGDVDSDDFFLWLELLGGPER